MTIDESAEQWGDLQPREIVDLREWDDYMEMTGERRKLHPRDVMRAFLDAEEAGELDAYGDDATQSIIIVIPMKALLSDNGLEEAG